MGFSEFDSPALGISQQLERDRRMYARWFQKLAESVSFDGPELREAEQILLSTSKADQIAMIADRIASAKSAAGRQSSVPRTYDGSRLQTLSRDDATGAAMERSRMLAERGSQAVRHAAMGSAGTPPGDADAHAASRAARAAIYAKMARDES